MANDKKDRRQSSVATPWRMAAVMVHKEILMHPA